MIAPPKDSNATKPKKASKKSSFSATRLVVWAAVAAAFAVIAFFVAKNLSASDTQPATRRARVSPIAPVPSVPSASSVPSVPSNQPPAAAKKPPRFWEVDAAHTNGFTEMQMRKWRKEHMPPPGYTNNAVLTRPKPKYAIFNHKCENLIAAYLTLRPGDGMIGTPILGERFRKEFLKSLETPIVVTEDDSPEDAQLKRDMIATKIDLKARMDAGEDICKIINDTHREVQDLSRYKTMLQKEISDAAKNPEMTMQDVDDLVEAANKMLEAKGIAPIALGPISRRLIQRRKGF